MSALFKALNESQKQAVAHVDGPMVVFAGAGSGKTRIITSRIAYLVEKGVRPWQILAVTFTNKAAHEMRTRVERLNVDANQAAIATFHSICARWLREFALELGFTSDFTIYDDSDASSALKKVVKELFPNVELAPLLADYKYFIHSAKINGLFAHEIESAASQMHVPDGGIEVYRQYQEYLAKCNAMDFGDLILNALLLLRRNTKVRNILQKRYRYVLVDEFQDTNQSQMELLKHLCSDHSNLFVVGDDDQSIYSWRGARPAHILNFERLYPGSQRVTMAENYRSRSNIVEAASQVISRNTSRAPKKLFSNLEAGDPIDYRLESDAQMEAWWVVDRIKKELVKFHYSDFAIFYRTNAQSRLLEEALRRERIPYQIFGAVKFYDRLEIKDLIAYFRLFQNEDDDISLKRIINVPNRGIGQKAVAEIEQEAKKRNQSMLKTVNQLIEERTSRLSTKLSVFSTIFYTAKEQILKASVDEAVGVLVDLIDYREYLQRKYSDQFGDKIENIHELSNALSTFARSNPEASLFDWLQSVSLFRDEQTDSVEQGVAMMTLHMAKGLEFERVFIAGVEEGLIPHRNNSDDKALLEEERRLLYVGMTRAKQKLSLVSAYQRTIYNKHQMNEPSRFIDEIPDELLNSTGLDVIAKPECDGELVYDFGLAETEVGIGQPVRHPSYGRGIIETLEDTLTRKKAVVRFFDFGLRKVAVSQLELA